ncbi:phosphoenolpyruvate carboxylase kinase 1 [Ricinus communis]|uniref:phosphoenolpyruvate carboxylase kinase 1 n=1 Tax=Ricinus communis TaxID=3988 RepID=UPI00201B01A1|nr:phosphoenolpyruvate carboxylase kinase 1 [Ricinus communis]
MPYLCVKTPKQRAPEKHNIHTVMSQALNREYLISEEIGRGRFGTVFKCTSRSTGHTFAVKSIDKSLTSGDTLDAQCLLSEPKILRHLSPHPHIIQLHNLYEDDTHLHMVIDLCSNQDLHSLIISSGGVLTESVARVFFIQIMRAVSHCHKYGVVHRDLKPDNILLDSRNLIKLADFGSAEVITEEGGMLNGVVGTPYYVAPEILSGREYAEKVDVWSAGVILYVMLAGFPPFYGETAVEIFDAVLRANLRFPVRSFHGVSPAVKDLLRRILCKDVFKRFSADQVLRHPWITSVGG